MSTLLVDQITDTAGANLSTVAGLFAGRVKAWGVLNGTGTPALTVSSGMSAAVTDNGTGDWTLTLTTPMTSANFLVVATSSTSNVLIACTAKTTTTIRLKSTTANSAAAVDDAAVSFLIIGTESI